MRQPNSLCGQRINLRCEVARRRAVLFPPEVLKEYTHVTITEVIAQDEQDIGAGGISSSGGKRLSTSEQKQHCRQVQTS
jgi:hypothetical protein